MWSRFLNTPGLHWIRQPEKQAQRRGSQKMLKWCLTQSCQPDGSFKISDLDDTMGDAYYYGVSFLADAGYFNPKDRFWTNRNFPGGPALRAKIEAKLKAVGLNNSGMNDAWDVFGGGEIRSSRTDLTNFKFAKSGSSSPNYFHRVIFKKPVSRDNSQIFGYSLGNYKTIKRIAMMVSEVLSAQINVWAESEAK